MFTKYFWNRTKCIEDEVIKCPSDTPKIDELDKWETMTLNTKSVSSINNFIIIIINQIQS